LIDSLFVPFEIYFIANKMAGLENGIYHYDIKDHALNVIQKGDFVDKISKLVHGQRFLERTAALVLITANFSRYNFRHRQERAYRNLLITGSEFAHELILNCTAKDIKTFQSPAMTDELAEELLKLPSGMEEPIYLIGVGK
jgi:SagB-type dehydrogenase family enzyme